MAPLRPDTLAVALARIFEGPMIDRASWFALTGGERLFAAGDPSDTLYLVRSGRLGVFHVETDQPPQLVGVIRPGEPVGEMAMVAGTPHTADVVALRDTEILALPREAFFEAARSEPDLLVELSRLMIHRARDRGVGAAEPSVFGFVSARPRPIRAFVERIAAAVQAMGFTCKVIDQSALSSAAEWFSRVEDDHDYVLYVAELDQTAWAELCARQVDRLFIVGSGLLAPPSDLPQRMGFGDGRRLTDLILLRDPRMNRPANTRVWLNVLQPDRWFHCVEGVETDSDRMARVITGTAVGLVLSGGGARAYCHMGAIKALEEARVPIDFVGGASMGAVVAAGPAMGWSFERLDFEIRRAFVESDPLSDLAFPIIAMSRARKVARLLERAYGDTDLADLCLPFFCVSSNLTSGRIEVHRAGPDAPGHARLDRHSRRPSARGHGRPGSGGRGGAEELPHQRDAPAEQRPHHRRGHVPDPRRRSGRPGESPLLVEMGAVGRLEGRPAHRLHPDALGHHHHRRRDGAVARRRRRPDPAANRRDRHPRLEGL